MQNSTSEHKPLLLIFPYNVMAHYLRCVQLAVYLKPHFDIRFAHSLKFQAFITAAGFNTFTCAALDADKVQQCMISFEFSWLNEAELNHIYQSQLKAIHELKPVAVLSDMSPTLKMAAEKTGVFHIALMNGYMSRYYALVRRMPGKHPLHSLFNLLPGVLFNYITNVGEQLYFRDLHLPFKRIRKRAKLSRKYSYMQELEGDINLVCDLPDLFPQRNLPSNYFVIPPLFHPVSGEKCGLVSNLDPNKKTLFISMGSTGIWKDLEFLNNDEFKKYNVVTAGDTAQVLHSNHIFSYTFVDSRELFEVVDLVICHGGNGTIYQALSFGIPVLCRTAHVEQEYNADGLKRLQLGDCLDGISADDC
ncbi:MAG: hypothetical protein M3040_02360, partial [Bacteroidota bacterium]|nr:hypothetical protein [Bacteroidota bacterium]